MTPQGRLRKALEALVLLLCGLLVAVTFLSPARGVSFLEAQKMQERYENGQKGPEGSSGLPSWPRLFCLINTIPSRHRSRVTAVQETWAPHCDEHVFSTTKVSRKEGAGKVPFWEFDFSNGTLKHDDHFWLWDRLRAAFRRIHSEKLEKFDWFLKADDDSFFIIENLKEMLAGMDAESPLFVISRHWLLEDGRDPNQEYGSGGAGYALSREAVRRFNEIMPNGELCRNNSYKHEDTEIGECLRNADVTFVDAVDDKGRHSMLPIDVADLLKPGDVNIKNKWAIDTSMVPLKTGPGCCSPRLISAHYVDEKRMYAYYYLVYGVSVAKRP